MTKEKFTRELEKAAYDVAKERKNDKKLRN